MEDPNTTVNSPITVLPDTLQRVYPRTIPGPVSPQNKGALEWGWQGFIAYGCQCTVVVVDPSTVQCIQTLIGHTSHVTKLSWRNTQHYHQLSASYSLSLASGDISGQIRLWDVQSGKCSAVLESPQSNKQVSGLCWLSGSSEGREHLLLALYPPHKVVLWETRHHTRVWTKTYTHQLYHFALDPFCDTNVTFLCEGSILIVNDLHPNKCPSSNGTKFFVASPGGNTGVLGSPSTSSTSSPTSGSGGANTFRRKMKSLVGGDSRRSDESALAAPCLQLSYHQTTPNRLLLLYPRELLVIDLAINVTVGVLALDRPMASFMQVYSCWRDDVLYTLHENGSVSVHEHKLLSSHPQYGAEGGSELVYERRSLSDNMRLSKNNCCLGLTVEPIYQTKVVLLLGDGRIVFKELTRIPPAMVPHSAKLESGASKDLIELSTNKDVLELLDDAVRDDDNAASDSTDRKCSEMVPVPDLSLTALMKTLTESKLRLCVYGCISPLPNPPVVLRMCPPLTTRNLSHYTPRVAVGSSSGVLLLVNTATGVVMREISVHTCAVRGIEWTSLDSVLSFAHQALTNAQGQVRNELYSVDFTTGVAKQLRTNAQPESPINGIRVSYLKQYFLVSRKNDPLELWCCQNLSLLRSLPQRFPLPTALEWSPTSHVKKRRKKSSNSDNDSTRHSSSDETKNDIHSKSPSIHNLSAKLSETSLSPKSSDSDSVKGGDSCERVVKETFMLSDVEGSLYHLSVEGNVIKDGVRVPPDPATQHITCIACKSHLMVIADTESNLSMWNLNSKESGAVNTGRGWIKRIRFAPGRDNLKLLVLFNDGADVWDIKEVKRVGRIKGEGSTRVLDGDWAASDRPILATADGSVKVMDVTLSFSSSPIMHYCVSEPIGSPYFLSCEGSLNLRTLLTHQPWRERYSLKFREEDGFTSQQLSVINTWLKSIPPLITSFLLKCNSTGHRALITSMLFGDQSELRFWRVAMHYLVKMARRQILGDDNSENLTSDSCNSSAEIISFPESSGSDKTEDSAKVTPADCNSLRLGETSVSLTVDSLETVFNLFCDSADYRKTELERLALQESKLVTPEQKARLCRHLSLLGERDKAVGLLLDEDSQNPDYYTACLRACLVAATGHSAQSSSTIKLVATNLIAAGKIEEGVELLCLVQKGTEACGYLQSYGRWTESVWLTRCCPQLWKQQQSLLLKWSNHLLLTGDKEGCILGLLSGCCLWEAVQQLALQHYHQRAALLMSAGVESGVLSKQLLGSGLPDDKLTDKDKSVPGDQAMLSLADNVQRKYALYLFGLGNKPAVSYLCKKLGEEGQSIMNHMQQ